MEYKEDLSNYLADAGRFISVPLTHEQIQKFLLYLNELKRWNTTINLTSLTEDHEIIIKHFVDSIALLRCIRVEAECSVLDIGAGAGFPSIPLKIVRDDLRPVLLESNAKKVSFIRYMAGILALRNITAVTATLSEYAAACSKQFDCVVVRALKIGSWSRQVSQLLKETGHAIVYRAAPMMSHEVPEGARIAEELTYQLPFGYGSRVLTFVSWSKLN